MQVRWARTAAPSYDAYLVRSKNHVPVTINFLSNAPPDSELLRSAIEAVPELRLVSCSDGLTVQADRSGYSILAPEREPSEHFDRVSTVKDRDGRARSD